MFNSICIVSVNTFNSGTLDKNGKEPIILNVVAGKSPNRTVLSGTVAERAGFEVGKTYLASCSERDENEYGRQFVWQRLSEASVMDVIKGQKELGAAQYFKAENTEVTAEEKVTANSAIA